MNIRGEINAQGRNLIHWMCSFFLSLSLSVCGYLPLATVGRVSEIKRKQRNISPARSLHVARLM